MSRPKGEYHSNNQQMSKLLHKAIGLGGKGNANGQVHISAASYSRHVSAAVDSAMTACCTEGAAVLQTVAGQSTR